MFLIQKLVTDNKENKEYKNKSIVIMIHVPGEKGKHSKRDIRIVGRRYNIMARRNTSDEKL